MLVDGIHHIRDSVLVHVVCKKGWPSEYVAYL